VDVTIADILSIGVGIASIVLAIVAIWFSWITGREVRDNFERTKEVLSNIEKKSAIVETTVTTAQKQLLESVTKILEETTIPQKISTDEQMGMALLQLAAQDPKSFENLLKNMGPFMPKKPGKK